jgi:hypothetical protein
MYAVNVICTSISIILFVSSLVESAVILKPTSTVPSLAARDTFRVVPVTSSTNSASAYTSPQIWVAQGQVDCGPSLFSNPCTSVQYSSTTFWTDDSSQLEEYVYSTYYYTTTDTIPSDRYSPIILSQQFTSTTPVTNTLNARSFNNKNNTPRTMSPRISAAPVLPTATPVVPITTAARFEMQNDIQLGRRSLDASYDLCLGIPPGTNLETNSLVDVCNFVSNANDTFVSLAPNAAAYMPTWLDYMMSFITLSISLIFIRIRTPQPQGHHEMSNATWETMGAVVSATFACIRTSLAVYQIVTYSQSFDTLPFISPLLWVDWLVIAQVCRGRFRGLALPIAIGVWLLCFWLCIGYAFLGYGLRQYEVLEMSKECEPPVDQPQISWETDPRRFRILDLHLVIFAFASCAFFEGWTAFRRVKLSRDRLTFFYGHEIHKLLSLGIGIAVLICLAAGMALVGLLNKADYLILTQNTCYASYVSSRNTYMFVSLLNWPARLAELCGLNI